jgi:hypothetical protein
MMRRYESKSELKCEVPEVALPCHSFGKLRTAPEAEPKDLANEKKEILRFA